MADETRWGRADWPGVIGFENACSYTYRHGTAPSVATLTLPIGTSPFPTGNLLIYDGSGKVLLQDCRVDQTHIDYAEGKMTVAILDRRWRWAFGAITGVYNVRDENDQIIPGRVRNARDLAALLFLAMGELAFDLETLPVDDYPPVNWQDTTPAQALESLVGPYDCQVCLNPFDNIPKIVKRGIGGAPSGNLPISYSAPSVDFPETPSVVVVAGADVEYEAMFYLEAVGLDTDGTYKPINELSYCPLDNAGKRTWEITAPPTFSNIPRLALLPDQKNAQSQHAWIHQLAEQTVFKCYRVDVDLDVSHPGNKPMIPEYGRISSQNEININGVRLEQSLSSDGYYIPKPAEVTGRFIRDHQTGKADRDQFGNSHNDERVNSAFSVKGWAPNGAGNMVVFSDYIYRRIAGDKITAADLRLRCSVRVRDPITWQPSRLYYGLPTGATIPAGAIVVNKPELRYKVQGYYVLANPGDAEPQWILADKITNRRAIEPIAQAFASIAANYYKPVPGLEVVYAGIVAVQPDGAKQEITWSVGVDGAPSTKVSQNRRHAFWLPDAREVRLRKLIKPQVLGDSLPEEIIAGVGARQFWRWGESDLAKRGREGAA